MLRHHRLHALPGALAVELGLGLPRFSGQVSRLHGCQATLKTEPEATRKLSHLDPSETSEPQTTAVALEGIGKLRPAEWWKFGGAAPPEVGLPVYFLWMPVVARGGPACDSGASTTSTQTDHAHVKFCRLRTDSAHGGHQRR
jgi:hypothetical protein